MVDTARGSAFGVGPLKKEERKKPEEGKNGSPPAVIGGVIEKKRAPGVNQRNQLIKKKVYPADLQNPRRPVDMVVVITRG